MSLPERSNTHRPQSPFIFVPPEAALLKEIDEFEKTRQAERAREYFNRTIFPEYLKNFAFKTGTFCNPVIYPYYWPKIEKRSAVEDLIWNMTFLESVQTDSGYQDVYSGQALAIEVNPNGDLLFHAEKDPEKSGLILPQLAWAGEKRIQKSFFERAFVDSKHVIYSLGLNGPTIHD